MSAQPNEGNSGAPARPLGPDGKPIPGPEQMRQIQAARKMAQQQAQVNEVIGIMHQNVENVLERDQKLSSLEERADALQDGSAQFEKRAASLKNKFWLENLKSMIAMGIVGGILLLVVYFKFFAEPDHPQMQYMMPPPPQMMPPPAPAGGAAAAAGGGGGTGADSSADSKS